jgi:tRNA(Phe) wybutosine-synthesizing methylase Tyw3
MLIQNEIPFTAHVFVCTNDRGGERKSCAWLVKAHLKRYFDEWQETIAGCCAV